MKTMKTKQAPTNIEKVTVAMEFGSPMNQIVIMTGIDKYCERVLREEKEPDNWGNLSTGEHGKRHAGTYNKKSNRGEL